MMTMIYFVKCTSPFWSKTPPQQILPPPYITVGMVFTGLQASSLFSKSEGLCPCANCDLSFLCCIWSDGFFLSCQYRTCFTVDNGTLLPISASIFVRSFAFVLELICTFHIKACSSLGHRTRLLPERDNG